jgi:hypothetical protein
MPWMPEVFTTPMAEARRVEEATPTNDAIAYYEGIMADEPEALIRSFAGEPRLNDPRVGYGLTDIPPQAGVAFYERGSSGLLAARIYDDVEPPAVSDTSPG